MENKKLSPDFGQFLKQDYIPFVEADWLVEINKSAMGSNSYGWSATPKQKTGIAMFFPSADYMHSPQEAAENFKQWAELNNIKKYEIDMSKFTNIPDMNLYKMPPERKTK